MEKRSLFQMIFGNKKQDQSKYQTLQLLNNFQPTWTSFDGDLYNNATYRACIDLIARNCAKLSPKHIRYYYADGKQKIEKIDGPVQRLISEKPNELMNAYDFYYKVYSDLYLYNNAFIYIARDERGVPVGLYPINANTYRLLEYNNNVYIQFNFLTNGKKYTASLKDDVIHLKRFHCKNEILGGDNMPIIKTMSLKHIIDEGIINAIKTTQGIKGIVKSTKSMLKPEDVRAMVDNFKRDFIDNYDGSGIGGLDATTDFKEVNINPQTATDGQYKMVKDEILDYFGISEKMLQSNFTEDEWNAFYESKIEPHSIEASLEFTNKIFSYGERWHGNKIVFESNRLQYASNTTKINVLKEAGALGILTRNEAREILNLAPVENGDEIIQSLNYTNLGGNTNE